MNNHIKSYLAGRMTWDQLWAIAQDAGWDAETLDSNIIATVDPSRVAAE